MKILIVLCLSLASLAFSSALKVRWGPRGSDSTFLIDIPAQQSEIIKKGWVKTARPAGVFLPSLVMYCPKDDLTLCACFDDTGFISGLQISLSVEIFTNTPIALDTIGFIKWLAPDGKLYMTQQQYYVSEESLNKSPTVRIATRTKETLQEGVVWVPSLDGKLLKIDRTEQELAAGIWTDQACTPTMGMHYYYDMRRDMTCEALFPWFAMTNQKSELFATGFMAFGNYSLPSGKTMWFEQSPRAAVQATIPRAPECLYDWSTTPGLISMHIYYDEHPWSFTC